MSENDSGVDSGNDDSNNDESFNREDDDEMNYENVDDEDDEDDHNQNQIDHSNEIVVNHPVIESSENDPNQQIMLASPSTSQQSSSSMNVNNFSTNNNQFEPSTSTSSSSNIFRMRSISITEHSMDECNSSTLSSPQYCSTATTSISNSKSTTTSPIIKTNINLCGFNFTVNKQDLNKLWSFYNGQQQQQQQQQHNFIPKIKCTKKLRTLQEKSLRNAANCGDIKLIKQLLLQSQRNHHIDLNSCDERKRTALHFASVRGHNDIAWLLLMNGADPNPHDINGNTPLHLAVCSSKLDMVILLLKNGAICTSSDNNGRTPINLAHSKLLYLSKSLEKRRIILSSSSSSSSSIESVESSLEKLKIEVMKISIMLGIYLEKCTKIDSNKLVNMDLIKNRVEHSQTSQEIENDVNDLLKCLQDWAL
uniref:Protein HOS4-like isoform X2 n=1 Tax=Dermatophagoides pteronyssinus TaxID=6956 RepID=A0A6P6YAV2_DERPT|nr:protein HOS4-like isoform X2 [Dermatophagoides pteronyssinus]